MGTRLKTKGSRGREGQANRGLPEGGGPIDQSGGQWVLQCSAAHPGGLRIENLVYYIITLISGLFSTSQAAIMVASRRGALIDLVPA